MKRKSNPKSMARMNTGQLAQATREFEREFVADTFKAPGTPARARWQRATRKRGRPPLGRGVKIISVSVERGLLRRSDALARKMGLSRAALISRGLEKVLSATSAP